MGYLWVRFIWHTNSHLMDKSLLQKLSFQYPFRKYQKLILAQVDSTKDSQNKFHIVSPPGSGKTIVGIELIKRFGEPAVVFAPTSTIQAQWREKVSMFISEDQNIQLSDVVSISPLDIKPMNVFTYQLLSSPAENIEFLEEVALLEWRNKLINEGIVVSYEEAQSRIDTLRQNNVAAYTKELSKFYKKIKGEYIRNPEFDGTRFLHQNARDLIDRLVSGGVKVIILDEAHHLLDYWALVIKELIRRINGVVLIGLTATPPISANDEELKNYLSIIGDIDFEIPTPAVVKEGNLAPYQDLVYFCTPTKRERAFIHSMQKRFESLVRDVGMRESFRKWVMQRIIDRPLGDNRKQKWVTFFNSRPFVAVAGVKYLIQMQDVDIPGEVVEIEEMGEPLTLDDWVYLLTDYSLNFLQVSEDQVFHDELREIKGVLKSFGYALTEKGMRKFRSTADMILSLSEAKDKALVNILATEMSSMGEQIRAVVITDFEKQSATAAKYLEGILDADAGGAVRAFRYIVSDPVTTKLESVLLTGQTVLVDSDKLPEILGAMRKWQEKSGFTFEFETKQTEYASIVEVVGKGKDWRSNTYVRMMTELFEQGIVRCIVGTRGLLGEGWDSLSLNTLVDLTSATTSQTVNQIRGRSIRLDPNAVNKVANNWDVVCVDPSFEKGNQDFERFFKKHSRFYGLGSGGKIIKGILHVDESLGLEYATVGFKNVGYRLINARMLAKARNRMRIYREWKIGEEYSNFEYSATKLDAKDLKFKTVFTLKESLKAIFNNVLIAIGSFAFWYIYIFGNALDVGLYYHTVLFVLVTLFISGVVFVAGKNVKKYIIKGFIEVPLDSFLLDIGKALFKSLRETNLVYPTQSVDNVRVVVDSGGQFDVYLDYATTGDAQMFTTCLQELLGPVTNQRYLVSRTTDGIKIGFYSPIWWMLRKLFRVITQENIAYHPVPSVLSTNKKRANIFAKNWKQYVGGGELVYTRTSKGSMLLLQHRKDNRHKIKRMNYDVWK
ncbi:hypothetical protein COY32_06370 [candidate division WWE3 bacterium CG_4_10_14_0_2_um_filter_41_14]|uniref:Helicase ATP-binding domain-containing protein n=1 Tax=candidate division WWE3 bacterium CG_4_10_14_0_2_um_filter_41_14 TaxID=1975072 RepID=A0A2M7TF74_UNCKA|nr:MAG: hypothetical protein COY32_06370 [candidate division WWE3 bacterium CG_4_10_14_0_2_um_filter_41_14]